MPSISWVVKYRCLWFLWHLVPVAGYISPAVRALYFVHLIHLVAFLALVAVRNSEETIRVGVVVHATVGVFGPQASLVPA